MKKLLALLLTVALCLSVTACVKVNINTEPVDEEKIMAESAMTADPVAYSGDGEYDITFRYEPGGLEKADLSRAYVAYYPTGVTELVDSITGGAAGNKAATRQTGTAAPTPAAQPSEAAKLDEEDKVHQRWVKAIATHAVNKAGVKAEDAYRDKFHPSEIEWKLLLDEVFKYQLQNGISD